MYHRTNEHVFEFLKMNKCKGLVFSFRVLILGGLTPHQGLGAIAGSHSLAISKITGKYYGLSI